MHFGKPVKARVDQLELRIGDILLSMGKLDEPERQRAEAGPESQLFGQRLYELGLLDAPSLAEALDEQLARQLSWLAGAAPGTAFAYYDHIDLLEHWGGEQRNIDPLTAIWRAVEAGAPHERVEVCCDALSGKTLRLHPSSRVGRFGFGSHVRPVLDVLRMKPQTLAELEQTGLLDPVSLRELLYALVLTRHLDTGLQPLGVATGVPAAVAPTAPMSRRRAPSSAAIRRPSAARLPKVEPKEGGRARTETAQTGRFVSREEIEARLQVLDSQSHYELFGVERTATPEQIVLAFTTLARSWHPDRLSPELADLREAVTSVFARMTEASRVLGQAASRADYDRSLGGNAEDTEEAQVNKVLRAAESFQKAEILVKKRDLERAEQLAEQAHLGDPTQPEYAALYAWIRTRRPEPSEELVAQSLATLKGAVGMQPNNVKVRYYLATVLKLMGQESAALREFRFVAENDPGNLDAARELRLHDMRRKQERAEAEESSGLLGRLFKR
jgi:curved DNA-binding protein CbpA